MFLDGSYDCCGDRHANNSPAACNNNKVHTEHMMFDCLSGEVYKATTPSAKIQSEESILLDLQHHQGKQMNQKQQQ